MGKFLQTEPGEHYGVLPGLTEEELRRHDELKAAEQLSQTGIPVETEDRNRHQLLLHARDQRQEEGNNRNQEEFLKKLQEVKARIKKTQEDTSGYPGNDVY